MPTQRAELSEKNKYWISKHRFYEICHHCYQYGEWADEYKMLSIGGVRGIDYDRPMADPNMIGKPTENNAVRMAELRDKMELIERTAEEAEPTLAKYILRAVTTENVTYNYLRQKMEIPCEKKMYYDRRRKFYWLMSKKI